MNRDDLTQAGSDPDALQKQSVSPSLSLDQQIDALPESLKESVSALVDGELNRSESAFLLKRIEHDVVLRGLWLRYQDCGTYLRGQSEQLQPIDFTQSIMDRIALEEAPHVESNVVAGHTPDATAVSAQAARSTFVRYFSAVAIAASVAAVTVSLQNNASESPAPAVAALAPAPSITVPSPSVSTQTVSSRVGAPSFNLQSLQVAPIAIDEFLLEHGENIGGRSAIAPMVYRISEADASYLTALDLPTRTAAGQ